MCKQEAIACCLDIFKSINISPCRAFIFSKKREEENEVRPPVGSRTSWTLAYSQTKANQQSSRQARPHHSRMNSRPNLSHQTPSTNCEPVNEHATKEIIDMNLRPRLLWRS